MKIARCPGCSAIVTDEIAIMSYGNERMWSKNKLATRVCQYARKKGKKCLNSVQDYDAELSWEENHKTFLIAEKEIR